MAFFYTRRTQIAIYGKMPKKAMKKKAAAKKTTKPKRAVQKQNQHRVEYKDRISQIITDDLTELVGNSVNGPDNSVILIPKAYTKAFTQGPANGQIEGNSICPRYLSMKVKLDFSRLPQYVKHSGEPSNGTLWDYQKYDLYIQQVWIKETLNEYRTASFQNINSGRLQPAFTDEAQYNDAWNQVAKKFAFNSRIQSEFLSYEKKADNQVRVVRKWRVLGDQNAGFGSANLTGGLLADPGPDASVGRVSPDKHYTFKWEMPKDKQFLAPIVGAGGDQQYGFYSMWVPAVIITLKRKYGSNENARPQISDSPLLVSSISHFTYTDA
jgi:hypothetical protein